MMQIILLPWHTVSLKMVNSNSPVQMRTLRIAPFVAFFTLNLRRMCFRSLSTVCLLINNFPAISLEEKPSETSCMTSFSRRVSEEWSVNEPESFSLFDCGLLTGASNWSSLLFLRLFSTSETYALSSVCFAVVQSSNSSMTVSICRLAVTESTITFWFITIIMFDRGTTFMHRIFFCLIPWWSIQRRAFRKRNKRLQVIRMHMLYQKLQVSLYKMFSWVTKNSGKIMAQKSRACFSSAMCNRHNGAFIKCKL